ncbi:transposase [Streptomyces sp. NBC_01077]|nr:transposase [Streptomyces sp. NBC_01077]WSV44343.1 transposase [Streptomyces sp. NBC_01077]
MKRSDGAQGFVVLPRRWVVERTLSWICRRRRCVRDYERLPAHHEAMVKWSMIILMTRRLARQQPTRTPHRDRFSIRHLEISENCSGSYKPL